MLQHLLLIGMFVAACPVLTQDPRLLLDQDPVFKLVMKRHLSYPLKAANGAYGKVYAGFSVDEKGHVKDISILNPVKIGFGFEEEVTTSLRRLPVMNPRYAGAYVLPVNFIYVNDDAKATETSATEALPNWYFSNRTVLGELRRENIKPFRERSMKYMRYRDTRNSTPNYNSF